MTSLHGHRGPGRGPGARRLCTGLLLLIAALAAGPLRAQQRPDDGSARPGLGIVAGEGRTENGATLRRYGFTSRRLRDDDRIGSLSLLYEEHTDGLEFSLLDESLSRDDVRLRYQSIYAEVKRYFPLPGPFLSYWGLRGGYSRVQGRIDRGPGRSEEFEAASVAPLYLLALPFALEHPGFLLLAFTDGASVGATVDLVPDHVWLDVEVGAVVLPRHRDDSVVLEKLIGVTRTVQLVAVF